jgi:hypothetical protein
MPFEWYLVCRWFAIGQSTSDCVANSADDFLKIPVTAALVFQLAIHQKHVHDRSVQDQGGEIAVRCFRKVFDVFESVLGQHVGVLKDLLILRF